MTRFVHKRGDTFGLAGPGTLPAGVWTASAQLRSPLLDDRKVADLEVTLVAQVAGDYTHLLGLSAVAADTQAWPVGELELDVQFVDDAGTVRSTQTITVVVVKDVTRG